MKRTVDVAPALTAAAMAIEEARWAEAADLLLAAARRSPARRSASSAYETA